MDSQCPVGACGCIHANMKRQMDLYLDAYRSSGVQFQDSRETAMAEECVRQHGAILLFGSKGSGKTTTARHIMLKLRSEGYEIIKAYSPSSIRTYLNPEVPQVFLFDGTFGTGDIQFTDYVERNRLFICYAMSPWLDIADELRACLNTGKTKLIATASKSAYKMVKSFVEELNIFNGIVKLASRRKIKH